MPIVRKNEPAQPAAQFSIGVNVILTGSKKMSAQQQESLLPAEKVRILIVDAADETHILVDEEVPAREFSTGSVGYGLNIRAAEFKKR